MILTVFVAIFLLLLCWLLLSPLIISIDTRVPVIKVKWVSIATISLLYQEKWVLKIHVLFYNTIKDLYSLKRKKQAPKNKEVNNKTKKTKHPIRVARAIVRVIKSFSMRRWHLTLDTGNYALNGCLYSLYALPSIANHIEINFQDKNYLLIKMKNTPLRMIKAYLNIQFF
jgi:hypothetical protein